MGLKGACGFEHGVDEIRTLGPHATIQQNFVHGPVGKNSLKVICTSGVRDGAVLSYQSAQNSANWVRIYFLIHVAPTAENRFIALSSGTGFTALHAGWITLDAARTLGLYGDDGIAIGSRSAVVPLDTYYYVEIHYDKTPAGGAQLLDVRLGVGLGASSQFAGSTTYTYTNQFQSIVVGSNLNTTTPEAQSTGEWYFDDIAQNGSAGSFENGFPGPGDISVRLPNGAGASSGWTPSAGLNYQCVDENPANDATDFVSSNTLNATDDYSLEKANSAIDAYNIVKWVAVYVRSNGVGASLNASFVCSLQTPQGGTKVEGAAVTPSNTSWVTGMSASQNGEEVVAYITPDGAAWTNLLLDALRAGYRLSVVGTNAAQVTALWVQISTVTVAVPTVRSKSLLLGVG